MREAGGVIPPAFLLGWKHLVTSLKLSDTALSFL